MAQESGRGAAAPPSIWRNIPAIRGAAIAGMVVTHSIEFSLGVAGILDDRPAGWPRWQTAIEVVGRALGPQCIPVFLFASGFFMYRFSRTWSAAWGSARSIAVRYVMWSLPGYLFLLLVERETGLAEVILSFLTKGPYYGTYWFLVLLFQLSLAAPLLARWVDASPRSAVAFAVGLQLIASAHYYWSIAHGVEPAWRFVLWRLPSFMAGMIVSARSDDVAGWLHARRGTVAILLVLSQLALVAESVLLSYAQDKVSLVLASALLLAWSLPRPARSGRVRAWLATLGMNSMAVFLASDLLFAATVRLVWHAGAWLGLPAPPPGVAPAYMRTVLVAVPFLLAGLAGPLLLASAVERLLGKPARRLVFG